MKTPSASPLSRRTFLCISTAALSGSLLSATATTPPLTVYCAAGLKKPVEQIAELYRTETGTEVQLQYGATGTLLANLRVAKRGDLFIAADDASLNDARKFDLIREVVPLLRQHPVIAVRKGNPKAIRKITDLLRNDVRLALVNHESASVGKATVAALQEDYAPFAARAIVTKPTVMEVANDLKLGAVDAAILWDSTVNSSESLESVEVPGLSSHIETASAAVLSFSSGSTSALRFARFLASPDKGGTLFKRNGFTPLPTGT